LIIFFAVKSGNIVEDFEKITSTGQWTEERIRELEKSYHSYMQVDDCSTIAGEKINGVSAITTKTFSKIVCQRFSC